MIDVHRFWMRETDIDGYRMDAVKHMEETAINRYTGPERLYSRYDALRDRALSRGELGRFLVTFLDNHDQIGQNYKRRFRAGILRRGQSRRLYQAQTQSHAVCDF